MSVPAPQPSVSTSPEPSQAFAASAAPAARALGRGWLALMGAVALAPAVIAVTQLGRIHPDEVYQVLEPAWHRAHGYGVLAWEWQDGLRNWAVPLLFSWLLRLASLLGLTHPQAYRALLELPQLALHGWMLLATYRYAERRAGQAAGLLATLLMGLYGPVLVFGGRTMSESFSAAFLVIALEALDRRERLERAGLLGGLALGLAVVTRYGSAVVVLAALVWLGLAGRWRVLAFTCLGGLAVALGLGALDWSTWGSPFHSLLAYLRFNVFTNGAAQQFGAHPRGFYVPVLLTAIPLWVWLTAPLGLASLRRRAVSLPLFCAAVYVAAVSATPHKEERFLYPALVLLVLAAAPAIAGWLMAPSRLERLRWGGAALALVATVAPAASYPPQDLRADQFRAIVTATRDARATGLLIVNEGLWGAGGFFYLGKNIPWLTCDWPHDWAFQRAIQDPAFNRAVTFEGRALPELQAAGFRVVGQVGRETMLAR
ncbi:glycosyltransferase family 39 protein [Hyalangium rubrum]|uniref:Glycosyltransferase family 39 protein n=1 Tax=Hyalangium rubrum TaxID=3103134 RepID=A0ABU5H694_9BACT|nr:glycosyltransferase family 39 protein [Hyalangium sp. s54d21]MDY7228996.1 glycosyltransferase family 39 protein [Hyalangium sp. s54d21]